MPRAMQEANIDRRDLTRLSAASPPFGRVAGPARWSMGAVLVAVGCAGVLLLLNSLFWILLKVGLAVAALVFVARRFGSRGLAYSLSDALRALVRTPYPFLAAGTLLLAAYALAGSSGILVAAGVCLGVFVRARLIDWP